MYKFKYLIALFALMAIGFTSCTKENTVIDQQEEVEIEDPTTVKVNPLVNRIETRSADQMELGCLTIDLPFSLDVDGTVVEINSIEDLEALFSDTSIVSVDFIYPLEVTLPDGSVQTVNNGEELGEAFAACIPDNGWGGDTTIVVTDDAFPAFLISDFASCYNLVYPVDLYDLDNETYTANSEEELINLLASTDPNNILFFTFPLSVEDEDGNVYTAEDGDELFTLLFDCVDDPTGGGVDTFFVGGNFDLACYSIQFPITVELSNGDVTVVNNHEEFCALMLSGYTYTFTYPMTVVDADGNEIVLNSEEDLQAAIEDCGFWTGDNDFFVLLLTAGTQQDCYTVNYPITVTVDGVDVEINSSEDLVSLTDTGSLPEVELPISITLTATGEVVEINDMEDIFEVLEDCE